MHAGGSSTQLPHCSAHAALGAASGPGVAGRVAGACSFTQSWGSLRQLREALVDGGERRGYRPAPLVMSQPMWFDSERTVSSILSAATPAFSAARSM